jgi:hypothetical protein
VRARSGSPAEGPCRDRTRGFASFDDVPRAALAKFARALLAGHRFVATHTSYPPFDPALSVNAREEGEANGRGERAKSNHGLLRVRTSLPEVSRPTGFRTVGV